jgi:dTMP kinase
MLGSRTATPVMVNWSPIYLTTAADPGALSRIQSTLQECSGSTVVTAAASEKAARSELGAAEAEAAGVRTSTRLRAIDAAELVVAEVSGADATIGAEVMYALHTRRVPVLCLWRRGEGGAFVDSLLGGLTHPLLETGDYADQAEADALLANFATPPEQPGRIFVVEGGDGAGKQTQSAMLRARLQADGYPVSTLDYPHDAALHGKLIRTLLSGAKGDIKQLNPLLFASLYAQNRADTAPLLNAWLKKGHNVILDRYVEANFGHQASKLPVDERPALINQLGTFEHDWLDLPRAHRVRVSPEPAARACRVCCACSPRRAPPTHSLPTPSHSALPQVVYLDLPPTEAAKAMASDGTRAALDIHETAGADYKTAVRDTFVWCTDHFDHWVRVACVDDAGGRYSKQELSDVLLARLAGEFVNRNDKSVGK